MGTSTLDTMAEDYVPQNIFLTGGAGTSHTAVDPSKAGLLLSATHASVVASPPPDIFDFAQTAACLPSRIHRLARGDSAV